MQIPSRLAFVDLETTGANPVTDRITEIGLVLQDEDGQVQEWSSLVNPGVAISPFIEELTGISNAMVASAPAFAQVMQEVLRRLEGRLFIAHNARFDYGFLKAEFDRAGLRFRAPTLCTVKLSRKLFPEHHKHNLDALMARHGLEAESRHRALSDARLIHQFWQHIQRQPGPEAVLAAVGNQLSQPRLPPQLDPHATEDLPDTPGVYSFFDTTGQALLVGRAKDLRKRILSHFASPKDVRLNQEIQRLEWQECDGELGAQLLEAALIKRLQPTHNRHLKPQPELCTWQLDDRGEGWLQPRLELAQDLDFSLQAPCYGLYRNRSEALEALRALATELRLCDTLLGLGSIPLGQACAGLAGKRCKGACVGKEAPAQHSMRLMTGLTRLKLQPWPFAGPALLQEGRSAHVVDAWRYLGSIRNESEIPPLLETRRPLFDKDIYRILVRHTGRFQPLRQARAWAAGSGPR